MAFYDTTEVVRALEKWLGTIILETGPKAGEPLFETVTKLDTIDLVEAAEKTISVDKRLCCVVPGEETYRAVSEKPLTLVRSQEFFFVMSAVDYSPFYKEAYFGYGEDPDQMTKSGLLLMKDLLINKLFGQPLKRLEVPSNDPNEPDFTANYDCVFVPKSGQSARFTEDENNLSDVREGYILSVLTTMGTQQGCLSRGNRRPRG